MMSTKTKTAPLSSYRDPIILITGCVIGAILGLVFEMYPLYWTPSKEGTFCVIRLNLS